jgi:hypothetical protein
VVPLRDLQRAFRDALLGGDATASADAVFGDGVAPDSRLAIYRHHVLASLTAALKATYPVVCRLVDERFFGYAADTYIRAFPPTSPCLFEYGASFADFLAAFPPCRHLEYLPDVARLEWAMNAALHAGDAARLDPADLARVSAVDLPRLTLAFEPSLSLLASPWPIDHIWLANHGAPAAPTPTVDVGTGGARLQVRRVEGEVAMRTLESAAYALVAALAHGLTLGEAAAAALAQDPSFDLTRALHELIEERIAVDFSVSN